MTAPELFQWLAQNKMKVADLAPLVGYSRTHLYSMLRGEAPIPPVLALALKALERHP